MYKFIFGLVLGICLALGVAIYLNKNAIPFVSKATNVTTTDGLKVLSTPVDMQPGELANDSATPNTSFDFYTILKKDKGIKTPKGAGDAKANEVYFIQTGVFNKEGPADAMKANLTLSGYNVRVTVEQSVTKTTYHVIVGPFSTKGAMQKEVINLNNQGFKTTELKSVN